jgi:hypothetical protein
MKTKFTPGPWTLETVPTSCGICHKIGKFPKTPEKTTAACIYVDYNAHADEMLANAHLIAAAPALYEALANMCGQIEALNAAGAFGADYADAVAALKLARGEA